MQMILSARHGQIDDTLRKLIQARVDHLERFEPRANRAEVTLTEEKNHWDAEALISVDRADRVHAHASGPDARTAADRLVEKLARQLRRRHDRRADHQAPPLEDLVEPAIADVSMDPTADGVDPNV